ncbi:hypothetical protein NW762_012439 [Fusarium torreyae]|uniref:Condensation domain-containing protein n=1 Tax=Fusarium torreyae TaxID=1237075 RepID=A0A9W8VBC5_9HYPO|nr:hypothetical protein NW762_012439 [Fusarium torreyae]
MGSFSQSTRFQWQPSSHGAWERDLDECEEFYRSSTKRGQGCFPVTGCVSFQLKTLDVDSDSRVAEALQKAWTYLRYQHPTLGSSIERDDKADKWKRAYRPFQNDEHQACWLRSTFKTVDSDTSALKWLDQAAPSFDVPTVFLVRSKEDAPRQTLFLRCPHDITDGVGILQLVDQLFVQASLAYVQRDEYRNVFQDDSLEHPGLSPSLRIAASIPESLSESQMERFQDIQTKNAAIYNHPGLLSLPSSSDHSSPLDGRVHRLSISIPEAISTRILTGCKAVAPGISVTHVFTSALVLALRDLQPRKHDPYPVRYVNHAMVNLRPYCSPPYDSPDHAAAAYHTVSAQALGIDLVVPGSTDDTEAQASELSRVAIEVRDFYKQVKPVLLGDVHEQIFLAPLTFKTLSPPPGSDPHSVPEPPFCPVALSSIGNVAALVTAPDDVFELTSVWAASEPIGAGTAVFLGGWNGKIELSSVFNTQYHQPEYLNRFLRSIVDHVYKGFGIGE